MKHLEIDQLKKYGERRLNAEEMMQAVLHLDECGACFDSLYKMFPALSDRTRKVSPDLLTAGDAEVFHLDYAEHLRPYVDFEADEVTREIVESHSENCSSCARAVRDLREFSDSLRLRHETKKADFANAETSGVTDYRPRRLATENFWRLAVSSIAVLILGSGGWIFWRQSASPNFIVQNQTSNAAPQISANENAFDRQSENLSANREVKTINLPILPREINSANKKSKAIEAENLEPNPAADERLLAALPPDFRVRFQNAVQTQKIELPAFIAELREDGNLRGAPNDEKKLILSPNAQAVRDLRPTFRWRKFAAGGESYVITIYDKDFNQVVVSPVLQATKWQSNVSLERGKIYKWQIKTAGSAETFAARFRILDAKAAAGLRE
ncbi:MAG: hypothetical protein LH614_04225, partial [Pyrinomonadaceae bacterium]|nr:hypothetical protein [Pyrinomonadaceae bacterium]